MKFNKKDTSESVQNYMGARSFKQTEKEELAFAVLSSFIEDSYYESKDKRISRISELVEKIAKKDPLFIGKLAIITRREFHMRSSFHVLVAELAKFHKGDGIVKNTLKEGVERPDDLMEVVAYSGKPIPNSIKKGVASALTKFNAYQLMKYKGESKTFSLIDLFNLVRPKPISEEQAKLWGKLLKGELTPAETWEKRLSSGEEKKQVWGEMVGNNELGYMALLRNLRNMLKQADLQTIKDACEKITDKEAVKKSKQLPFRFLSAYNAVSEHKDEGVVFEKETGAVELIKEALNKALSYSVDNIPLLKGRTVILTDNSGSMRGDSGGSSLISAYSNRKTSDIANLFAILYWLRADNTLVGLFGDELILPKLDREKDLFTNFKIIDQEAERCGGATEKGIFDMFEKLIKDKTDVDRIVIFSDCQVGDGCQWYDTGSRRGGDFNRLYQEYKKINPKVQVYSVDLKGYGNTLFSDGVVQMSGWSDKIFEILELNEKREGLVKYIEEYPIQLL